MNDMRYFLAPLMLAAILSVPASGQALKGHNAKAPVDVAADRIEVQDRADRGMFIGNVVVRQGWLTLNASRLTVAYSKAGSGLDVERLDATGGVRIVTVSETASGDFAVYDLNRRLITMVGGVVLTQGANQIRGGRLMIDLDTGRAVVDGRSTGGSDTPGTGSSGGRVTGRFNVAKGS